MRSFTARTFAAALTAVVLSTGIGACDRSTRADALVVQEQSRILARFTIPQLNGLPQVEIATPQSHGAQTQTGPTVRSILQAARAADITGVRVEGRDPAQTLSAVELAGQIILNVTKRGTLKLTGAQLDRSRWVRDVTDLVVNP
ncbi:hypothetical protein A5707_07020 [Mycobacterium kyorinense]|uniref:Uncharacterized protein n=1 Tax=Mycobacterium kyorinense TaxID=487514 RepID=A0A1A2YVY7_9MYCO|nr:hypothetical protein [Mycobacterium kyorinense]OBI41578.1 hypothetical protein A5707_07020 [Mycobacterium kyorinense]